MALPEMGRPVPDFHLRDQFGQEHRLSDHRGRSIVVVMFFPFAFTPVCEAELAEVVAAGDLLSSGDVVTYGISCDPVASLKAFAEQRGIDFPLLSDFWPHGQVADSYGVFLPERGFANRGTFIVGRDGLLGWSVVTSPGEARSADDYRRALASLA